MLAKYSITLPKYIENEGFTLGLAEKPSAASKIAKFLDKNSKQVIIKVKRKQNGKTNQLPEQIGHFVNTEKGKMFILSAAGHLYTVVQEGVGWQYPVYDFKWSPKYQKKKKKDITIHDMRNEAAVEAIKHIANMASDYIVMTDYDEEGEVIGGVILSQILGNKILDDVKRMKFSTLTKNEINKSFLEAVEGNLMNFGMYNRGLMRHYLDWLWGINLSRALMHSLKNTSGQYLTLSTGRVQGPTLAFVSERQMKIDTFVPRPSFDVNLTINAKDKINLINSKGVLEIKSNADKIIENTIGQVAKVIDIITRTSKKNPPEPLNLSKLQDEAHKYFSITSSRTLQSAQRLYMEGVISYPRTSSQKYPSELDHDFTLSEIAKIPGYKKVAGEVIKLKRKPIEGKKTDPAHPCIYPTGVLPKKLTGNDKKVFDLIVRNYFSTFGDPAIMENNRINFDINKEKFHLTGRRTKILGWKKYAGRFTGADDKELPKFNKGDNFKVIEVSLNEKFSKGPAYYNDNSLRKKMEQEEIGTKATRGDIISSLFQRKYLRGKRIEITPVGEIVFQVLSTYSAQVVSVELSRKLENMGDMIENSVNNLDGKFSLSDAMVQGLIMLHGMLKELQENERKVGESISTELQSQRKIAQEIGGCLTCKIGTLKIIRSTLSGKRFVGCSEYFNDQNCNTTYPLPQGGMLETTKELCKADEYPQVKVYPGGRRPWTLCLNPTCSLREEFEKRKKKVKE
ncbi:MAG: DNA topoisomerase I [Candidatus Heimdallarchaeota archaeon]